MRVLSPLGQLLVATVATAALGEPLMGEGGKFSASNIAPILFCVVALPLFMAERKTVDRRVIWFLLAFNASALLSFAIFLVRYRWEPNFLVLLFQDVEVLFCLLLVWYGGRSFEDFRRALRLGMYASLLVSAYWGWLDYSTQRFQFSFGMDDKSHSAVLFCCEAYILVRFFGGKLDHLAALAFVVFALLTVSREPGFLIPPVLLALTVRSRWGLVVGSVLLAGIVALFAVEGDTLLQTFSSLNRLTSLDRVADEDSTITHFLLIRSSLEMKFADLGCFLFGIGPGNFSKALSTYQVLLPEIQAVDPILASAALEGRTPMHSVPLSLLLDMNIPMFLLCCLAMLKGFGHLWRTRNFVDLAFALGLFAASTFYSLHNKPYFYLVIGTLIVLVRGEQAAPLRSDLAAGGSGRIPERPLGERWSKIGDNLPAP